MHVIHFNKRDYDGDCMARQQAVNINPEETGTVEMDMLRLRSGHRQDRSETLEDEFRAKLFTKQSNE